MKIVTTFVRCVKRETTQKIPSQYFAMGNAQLKKPHWNMVYGSLGASLCNPGLNHCWYLVLKKFRRKFRKSVFIASHMLFYGWSKDHQKLILSLDV